MKNIGVKILVSWDKPILYRMPKVEYIEHTEYYLITVFSVKEGIYRITWTVATCYVDGENNLLVSNDDSYCTQTLGELAAYCATEWGGRIIYPQVESQILTDYAEVTAATTFLKALQLEMALICL